MLYTQMYAAEVITQRYAEERRGTQRYAEVRRGTQRYAQVRTGTQRYVSYIYIYICIGIYIYIIYCMYYMHCMYYVYVYVLYALPKAQNAARFAPAASVATAASPSW